MVTLPEFVDWDGVEMARRVRRGDVTALELETACRERIDELNPALNAIAATKSESERTGASNDTTGVLAGVPMAAKELLAVPGLPWTMGSRLFQSNPPGPPTPYVEKMLYAGLNIVATTTSSEFGLLGSTESALHGTTRNPWGVGLSAGGSSGGSAAAVAARIFPFAHASDAGGSIRVPASLTGLFGFMPSRGRCAPATHEGGGIHHLLVDHCISRTVRDSAAMLAVTERTGAAPPFEPVGWVGNSKLEPQRIGVVIPSLSGAAPHPDVHAAVELTADLCESLGHHVSTIKPPQISGPLLSHAFFVVAANTVANVIEQSKPILGRSPGADELELFTLALADLADESASVSIEKTFLEARNAYLNLFSRCDVVMSPTLSQPPWDVGTLAPELDRDSLIARTEQLVAYTPAHNVAGCPAMSVPLHFKDGIPIGVHFSAPPGADAQLLKLAYQLEEAKPWLGHLPESRS